MRFPTFIRDWIASWRIADDQREEQCQLSNILLRDSSHEDDARKTTPKPPPTPATGKSSTQPD